MSNNDGNKRASWGSNFGFLMAAVGSAVGLGNLWGFPYKLGKNGGSAFLIIYILLVISVGTVVMVGEFALGRKTRLGPVGAYRTLDKRFTFNGWFGVIAAFVILSFYSVLGGWAMKYFITYVMEIFGSGFNEMSGGDFFSSFTSSIPQSLFFHALFMAVTALIVIGGVQKGIEKSSKIMMPALFIMLLLIIVRSLTLPNAMKGVEFMFKPDFSVFADGGFFRVTAAALSQMFFSLSLGMGALICYGSYLNEDSNIPRDAMIVPILDTVVAIMAGLAIMPAVFSFNLDPQQGPSLLYIVLREVFANMPGGAIFGCIFYLLVTFAAVTSSISLLEVSTSYFVDEKGMGRKKSTIIAAIGTFLLGIPTALSFGLLGDVTLPALNGDMLGILDWMDYISEYVLMTLGALIMCIYIGWVKKPQFIIDEVEKTGIVFTHKKLWSFMIKYVTPILVFITFITAAGFIKF